MLLRFRTANHRSLRDEVELSLVSQPRKGEPKPAGALPEAVLVAGIYGANASGKSNVLDAVGFLAEAVANSLACWPPTGGVPRTPFLLDLVSRSAPSLYEVDFMLKDVRHTYGFEVDDQSVRAEWLYSYPTGSRKRTLFEREGDTFRFGRTLAGSNSVIAGLVRPNSLFLSVAAANSHPLLTDVFRWIEQLLPADSFGHGDFNRLAAALSARHAASDSQYDAWIRVADLGIDTVRFEADDEFPGADTPGGLVVINKRGAQLVFTSHDVSLLGNLIDDEILDRDEVWFTEKDRAGATTLFPLTDFQPRRGENFERAYLQGRYGAVPRVDVDELRGLFNDRAAG